MRIDIRGTNVEVPGDVRVRSERRALSALSRYGSRIRKLNIVVTDINGPRGGIDTLCRVRVVGRDGWTITVSDVDHEAGRAIAFAVGRAGRAVARRVDRLRDVRGTARRQRRARSRSERTTTVYTPS